uniref:AHH domain-containing protein n=1 Tax=Archangium lipolyticum TaxID=2970465 RepID=UPI00214A0F06|nr:AHH domain-containing protein [Archangium lipolyticum]
MHPRIIPVLCLLLLVVPLLARAAPPKVEARLSVLEPVGVSEYHGSQGRGLKLSFTVAERFGKEMGGVGLRVLVTLAGARLARALPEVPGGGLWGRLSPPRFGLAGGGGRGGLRVGERAGAQVSVADGTVVLMGVTANTTAAAVASAVSAARTTGACAESKQSDNQAHHLCTNKNDTSDISGGPWTPEFEALFARAGMSLDDPANIVYLRDHKGPHPEEYHSQIFERLNRALGTCRTRAECRARLVEELDKIAGEICTPGSKLNKLATRRP